MAAGRARAPDARLALVTPSHHHPLGHTLSLARRLALLGWAGETGAWIIEDDYDSEYRYAGPPLAALMSLDGAGRVIYVGSFSKVMFRSLRLAYLVAPEPLAGPLRRAQAALGAQASLVPQAALASFMESGQFAAHVRRMRRLYGQRRRDLMAILEARLGGLLDARPADAGMHLVAALNPALAARMDDVEAARRAAAAGVAAPALSPHYADAPAGQGLLLGFGGFDEAAMDAAAERLAAALEDA